MLHQFTQTVFLVFREMGRSNQSEYAQHGADEPLWGWSGAAPFEYSEESRKHLDSVIAVLPIRQSTGEQLVAELEYLGAKYRRYLHQDEFGPTQAQQIGAFRILLAEPGNAKSLRESGGSK